MDRVRELQERTATDVVRHASIDRQWVLDRLRQVTERCMQAEPVYRMDRGERVETGEYTFNAAGANRSIELIGKELGMFRGEESEDFPPGESGDHPPTDIDAGRARLRAIGEA